MPKAYVQPAVIVDRAAKEQEEFGEFFEAPAPAAVQTKKMPEPPKATLWDDAEGVLDMGDLMKADSNQANSKKSSGYSSDLYGALYGKPAMQGHAKGIY